MVVGVDGDDEAGGGGGLVRRLGEALDQDGDEQAEEDVVAEDHEQEEVEGGPRTDALHARVQHLVPVALGEDLEDGDGGPEEAVEVLAARHLLAVRVKFVEFAAEQVHAQGAAKEKGR